MLAFATFVLSIPHSAPLPAAKVEYLYFSKLMIQIVESLKICV